jgi:CheY-like chemotaxis protein
VLYVDDEGVNRNVGKRMLQKLGCIAHVLTVRRRVLYRRSLARTLCWCLAHCMQSPMTCHLYNLCCVSAIVLPPLQCCACPVQDGSEVEPAFEGGMDVDMLLLDIQMKTMNGDVLCSLLRAQGDPRMMIAVTGEEFLVVTTTSAATKPAASAAVEVAVPPVTDMHCCVLRLSPHPSPARRQLLCGGYRDVPEPGIRCGAAQAIRPGRAEGVPPGALYSSQGAGYHASHTGGRAWGQHSSLSRRQHWTHTATTATAT